MACVNYEKDNPVWDCDLEFLRLGYESMSKSEHSPRTLQLLSLLNELKDRRERDDSAHRLERDAARYNWIRENADWVISGRWNMEYGGALDEMVDQGLLADQQSTT